MINTKKIKFVELIIGCKSRGWCIFDIGGKHYYNTGEIRGYKISKHFPMRDKRMKLNHLLCHLFLFLVIIFFFCALLISLLMASKASWPEASGHILNLERHSKGSDIFEFTACIYVASHLNYYSFQMFNKCFLIKSYMHIF